MDFKFVPTDETLHNGIKVPCIEDARADFAPYYKSRADIEELKSEILIELAKLGAGAVMFQEGHFDSAGQKRHGYRIFFQYGGARGLIRVAGLPMKGEETKLKLKQVRVQALANVRDWLKSAVTGIVFSPGSDVLIPHMLLPDGVTTVADHIRSQGDLPMLNPPPPDEIVVEG